MRFRRVGMSGQSPNTQKGLSKSLTDRLRRKAEVRSRSVFVRRGQRAEGFMKFLSKTFAFRPERIQIHIARCHGEIENFILVESNVFIRGVPSA
jgi:hypothetical protein